MKKKDLTLKRKLELVRTTIRELSTKQVKQVHGAVKEPPYTCSPFTEDPFNQTE